MSGGSFNYLYSHDFETMVYSHMTELKQMAERLQELGCHRAAGKTVELVADIERTRHKFETLSNELVDIWKAVEWYDSGDYGEERVMRAYMRFLRIIGDV